MQETYTLHPLYKKTATGAIQKWDIRVECLDPSGPGTIVTMWGQVDGEVQETRDVIAKGKNTGKKNETTAYQQAVAEAQAKWLKQKKKGYVESVEQAQAGEIDKEVIEGGIVPMLAHKYRDHQAKVVYPVLVQPKLNGHRGIAIVNDAGATLWSRTRKLITSVPHITEALKLLPRNPGEELIFDGELYSHKPDDFEKLTSGLRSQEPSEQSALAEYHIYDFPSQGILQFSDRHDLLVGLLFDCPSCIKLVETEVVQSTEGMLEYFQGCLERGYEGCMIRKPSSLYENKRSANLLKVKEMEDAEFKIVGVKAGRGKMADKGIFICLADNGETFDVKMKGKMENLIQYLQFPEKFIGKQLTVAYQALSCYGTPLFGVGLRIKEDL
jgi:ATP-dependent DNA ligase